MPENWGISATLGTDPSEGKNRRLGKAGALLRRHGARLLDIGPIGRRGPVGRVPVLGANRAVDIYLRPVARQRLRYVFIGHTHRGALRIERRIVLIGPAPLRGCQPTTAIARAEIRRMRSPRPSPRAPTCRDPDPPSHIPSNPRPVSCQIRAVARNRKPYAQCPGVKTPREASPINCLRTGVFSQRSEETQSEGENRRLGKARQNSRAGIENWPAPEFFAAAVVAHGLGTGTAAENADQPPPILKLA